MDERTAEQIRTRITSSGLKLPRALTLMITDHCNLRCRHCWPESGSAAKTPPASLRKLRKLVQYFVQLGAEELCLTGGEPLTHPQWQDLLLFSRTVSGLKKVCIQTNGTLLTEENINTLLSTGSKGLTVQVSLEGATEETHDRLRGKGAFQRTMAGIKLLAKAGLGRQTVIAFTETADNFQQLPLLLELLDNMGIGRLVSGTLIRAGRAAQNPQLALPKPSQVEALLERFSRDKPFRERYERIGNIACLEWLKGRTTHSGPDCGCIETPYIKADGTMYPCTMLPVESFAIRDLYSRPAEEIFPEALALWADLSKMHRRQGEILQECRHCSGNAHCGGGCVGRSWVDEERVRTVEDRCALRKTVYQWKAPDDIL